MDANTPSSRPDPRPEPRRDPRPRVSRWNSDLVRVFVSSVIAVLVMVVVLLCLINFTSFDGSNELRVQVTGFVILWVVQTSIYVGWGTWVYSRLDQTTLALQTAADDEGERKLPARVLGMSGATNTTLSAAVLAVVITIVIAQRPEFRGEPIYVIAALVTVATSWILMVFSFAQNYLRLGAADDGEHLRFHFPERPRFSDYLTLAALVSAMAATTPAQISSRKAWGVVRGNVIIAFVFNSVVIAMMVSLLFGGLLN
ncbi:DUF1345 domain-containing protein [Marisediminicola sp. LYQ134]|uniref:DUF1345 domain-containing protein n=1 Tax=unclassified Marisediminicola TaxID=2618316 RepID=UPI003982EF07